MSRAIPTSFYIIILCVLIATNIIVYRAVSAPKILTATVFEVGKGRVTLVRAPSGKTILIDTGSDASILRALGTSLPAWQRSIDTIILTSDSSKNTGGLTDIQNRYHVAHIIYVGDQKIPYGATITLDTNTNITILASSTLYISYDSTTLSISSSTPPSVYTSNSETVSKD